MGCPALDRIQDSKAEAIAISTPSQAQSSPLPAQSCLYQEQTKGRTISKGELSRSTEFFLRQVIRKNVEGACGGSPKRFHGNLALYASCMAPINPQHRSNADVPLIIVENLAITLESLQASVPLSPT